MAGLGKRRCYGCIQARSSLPARFLILKAGQELRQELDLSLFPETDLTNLRKYVLYMLIALICVPVQCTWLLVTMSY